MIQIETAYDDTGKLTGFTVQNHGNSYVCGAISMLVINTINSIEALTSQPFNSFDNDGGGYISFAIKGHRTTKAGILLDAMLLGLLSAAKQYPDDVELYIDESDVI